MVPAGSLGNSTPKTGTTSYPTTTNTCEAVVRRFDGYVAEKLGDGLIAYFGWPTAHEDDAYRAVRTGLGVIDAMQGAECRGWSVTRASGYTYEIGIDTGIVVVGKDGRGSAGRACDGQRTQRSISPSRHRQARHRRHQRHDIQLWSAGISRDEDLGLQNLTNIANPVHAYRVVGEERRRSRA